jgi:predicted transcriptional regulator
VKEQGIEEGKIDAIKAFLDVFDNDEIAKRLNLDISIVGKVKSESK